jgi:hypothetical protein
MKLMKPRILNLTPLALLPAALLILTSCSSTSSTAPAAGTARVTYTKGVAGGVVAQTFKMTATVTAIDPAKRQATLLDSSGKTFIVKVGPEVAYFDQVHVGDQVNATVTETVVAHLDTQGANASEGAGKVVAENTQVTAKVMAIDSAKHAATFQFEDGTTQTLPIRDDVDLSRHKVGEQVVFHVTEIIATHLKKLK